MRQELAAVLTTVVGTLSADDQLALGFVESPVSSDLTHATRRKRRQRALERLRGVWRKLYGEP